MFSPGCGFVHTDNVVCCHCELECLFSICTGIPPPLLIVHSLNEEYFSSPTCWDALMAARQCWISGNHLTSAFLWLIFSNLPVIVEMVLKKQPDNHVNKI